MKERIAVVGSSNTDMVIQADHLPTAGETIIGNKFLMNPGGKGANQAVAAARLGGQVSFICKTGNDMFGAQSKAQFENAGIDTSYVFSDPDHPSGVALITVDRNAENCIVVASGANATLNRDNIDQCKSLLQSSPILLVQLEIPVDTVEYVAEIGAAAGSFVVLNPAPACPLSDALLKNINVITPNENEAELLSGVKITGIESATTAARAIQERGVQKVIITLGAHGALVVDGAKQVHVPGHKVTAVDTTAAGDVFNGALAVSLSRREDLISATRYACFAAALAVTRLGAQSSAPYEKEMQPFFLQQQF